MKWERGNEERGQRRETRRKKGTSGLREMTAGEGRMPDGMEKWRKEKQREGGGGRKKNLRLGGGRRKGKRSIGNGASKPEWLRGWNKEREWTKIEQTAGSQWPDLKRNSAWTEYLQRRSGWRRGQLQLGDKEKSMERRRREDGVNKKR